MLNEAQAQNPNVEQTQAVDPHAPNLPEQNAQSESPTQTRTVVPPTEIAAITGLSVVAGGIAGHFAGKNSTVPGTSTSVDLSSASPSTPVSTSPSTSVSAAPTTVLQTPIPTLAPLPTINGESVQVLYKLLNTNIRSVEDRDLLNSINDSWKRITDILSQDSITQANLATIQKECPTLANHFTDDAQTQILTGCEEIFQQAARRFAADFCQHNDACRAILETAITYAPLQLDKIIEQLKYLNQLSVASIPDLETLRSSCLALNNVFTDATAQSNITAACSTWFENAVGAFAPTFAASNVLSTGAQTNVVTILKAAAQLIPDKFTSVAMQLDIIKGNMPNSPDNFLNISAACQNIGHYFTDMASTTAVQACTEIVTESGAKLVETVCTNDSMTTACSGILNSAITAIYTNTGTLGTESFNAVVSGLQALQTIKPTSPEGLAELSSACSSIAENFVEKGTNANVTSYCQSLVNQFTAQFVTSVCSGDNVTPVFYLACSEIVNHALVVGDSATKISNLLSKIKATAPTSLDNVNLIKTLCGQITGLFAGNEMQSQIAEQCQFITTDAARAFGQSICTAPAVTATVINACGTLMSTAIHSISLNQDTFATGVNALGKLAAKDVLSLEHIQQMQKICDHLVAHATDAPTVQSIKDTCQTIVLEAARKVGYGEWLYDLATRHIANNIAYGLGQALKSTGDTAGEVIGWFESHASNLKEAVPAGAHALKESMANNPWSTTGCVAGGALAISGAGYVFYRYGPSIKTKISETLTKGHDRLKSWTRSSKIPANVPANIPAEKADEEITVPDNTRTKKRSNVRVN